MFSKSPLALYTLLLAPAGLLLARAVPAEETVTLPVAVSVVGAGGVPFVSDVRVFNTSYTEVLTVTAVYRFNGKTAQFQLAARESRVFDDICVSLFEVPSSLGAVEFTSSGLAGSLVVSSRLRSPVAGGGFVGMFIPGLPSSAARAVTVLTGLVNGDSRTNVGVYNPNAVEVTATIRLFDGPVLLGASSVALGSRAVTQVNNIYGVVGFGSLVRTNGYATVESSDAGSPLFTYAAEADNKSGDLILVVGAPDVAAPPGFNPPTATPTGGLTGSTPTPTQGLTPTPTQVLPSPTPTRTRTPTPLPTDEPPSPTPTRTSTSVIPTQTATPTRTPTTAAVIVVDLVGTQFEWNFSGGGVSKGPLLTAKVGQTYRLRLSDGDPLGSINHDFSGIPSLGIPFQRLNPGEPPKIVDFTPTSAQVGDNPFSCSETFCGSGHSNMLGIIRVTP